MRISDRIYGEFDVVEPILLELMASPSFLRLKGISQFGMPDYLFNCDGFSRYEHCVGVMLLLRKFGASLEEQVAGLLHDVSHTAFSHVIDHVIGDAMKDDFQDRNHEAYIRRTEIPLILERHGMTVERVVDYHRYTLLEQDAPALCADRLDYAFREFSNEELQETVSALSVYDGRFVFASAHAGLIFSRRYLRLQSERLGGYEAVTRFTILSKILRRALELEAIVMNDFWHDDAYVLNKLFASNDEYITRGIALLRNRDLSNIEKSAVPSRVKFRWIDPDVLTTEGTKKITELFPEYAEELAEARRHDAEGIFIGKFE